MTASKSILSIKRMIRNMVQDRCAVRSRTNIEDELAEEILSGKVKKDMEVVVTIHKEKVVFETK
mgnify:CR=1 FL=1